MTTLRPRLPCCPKLVVFLCGHDCSGVRHVQLVELVGYELLPDLLRVFLLGFDPEVGLSKQLTAPHPVLQAEAVGFVALQVASLNIDAFGPYLGSSKRILL